MQKRRLASMIHFKYKKTCQKCFAFKTSLEIALKILLLRFLGDSRYLQTSKEKVDQQVFALSVKVVAFTSFSF